LPTTHIFNRLDSLLKSVMVCLQEVDQKTLLTKECIRNAHKIVAWYRWSIKHLKYIIAWYKQQYPFVLFVLLLSLGYTREEQSNEEYPMFLIIVSIFSIKM